MLWTLKNNVSPLHLQTTLEMCLNSVRCPSCLLAELSNKSYAFVLFLVSVQFWPTYVTVTNAKLFFFPLCMATQEGKLRLIKRQNDVFKQAHTVCSQTRIRSELREPVQPKNNHHESESASLRRFLMPGHVFECKQAVLSHRRKGEEKGSEASDV